MSLTERDFFSHENFLSEKSAQKLGLNAVFAAIQPVTPYGKVEKSRMKPYLSDAQEALESVLDALEKTVDFVNGDKLTFHELIRVFSEIKGLFLTLDRLFSGEVLSVTELFEIKQQALQMRRISEITGDTDWPGKAMALLPVEAVITLLDPEGLGIPTFYIYSAYSEKLSEIRGALDLCESEMMALRVKHHSPDDALSEKREALLTEEASEELNVRKTLSAELAAHVEKLYQNIRRIGKMDFLLAKAEYALSKHCIRPIFSENGIALKNARFPALEARLGEDYMPIDLLLKEPVTVITGANMGGKTVALKTIGLICAMARYGLFVPCENAVLTPIDFIFTSIGDGQSTDLGLSTFGAEMAQIAKIIQQKNLPGLILLDEFGRGTNPREGSAISRAVLESLISAETLTVATTHDESLTRLAGVDHYQTGGLSALDEDALKAAFESGEHEPNNPEAGLKRLKRYMDYRLYPAPPDAPIPQEALRISGCLGLDPEIIARAKALLGGADDQ
jgi:hypothetical protein